MIRLLTILAVVMLFSSCSRTKDVSGTNHIPNRKTEDIVQSIRANELKCDWVSVKWEVEIKSKKIEDSFKMYARVRRDSAVWVSATYYAVEIARFLFTPDSVRYMDRKNNQYYIGDYSYITGRFMIEANFDILQSLILANSLPLVASEGDKLRGSKNEGKYLLSYLKKRQLKRAMKKEEATKGIDLIVSLWVEPESFRLVKTSLYDPVKGRTLTARYSEFENACNSGYPNVTEYTLDTPDEQATVKTSVMKLTTNKKVSLSFTIPDKYEPLTP